MDESITLPKNELDRLQERTRKLALEKSNLQLVNDLMNKVSSATGLENTVDRIIRLILDNIGGVNVAVYYLIDSQVHYADVYGGKKVLEAVDDAMVRSALETGAFAEETKAFGETMMLTPEFTKASSWALPLVAGGSVIGVLKMDGMLMAAGEMRTQLQPFFNYAALILKNEIESFSALKETNEQLQRSNRDLRGAQDALRAAYEELEARVVERTIDLQEANRLLTVELAERKKAETALKESEESIRLIIDASPVAKIVSSGTDERVLMVNRKFTELFGYTKEDIPDVKHWWPLAYPDESHRESIRKQWKSRIEKAVRERTEIVPMEGEVACKDGSRRYIVFGFSSIGDRNIVTFTDLTERKRAEEALRESEQKYREIFNNASDAMYLLEVTEDGRFRTLDVNPSLSRVTGIPHQDTIGRFVDEIQPEEANRAVIALYRRCVESGETVIEETELSLPAGRRYFSSSFVPLRERGGRIHRIVAISRDITERKKAEETLRKLNDELEARVKQRTVELEAKNTELERMNRLFVGRELRMRELKEHIQTLEASGAGKGRRSP